MVGGEEAPAAEANSPAGDRPCRRVALPPAPAQEQGWTPRLDPTIRTTFQAPSMPQFPALPGATITQTH